jgi:Carbohydrate binding domain
MQVFVCFAQSDQQFAELLIQQLYQRRVTVITPPEPSSTYTHYLKNIDAFILIVSERSLGSLYLRHLSAKFIGLQKYEPGKFFLPIFLDENSYQQAWSTIRPFQSLVKSRSTVESIIQQSLYLLGLIDVISIQESGPLPRSSSPRTPASSAGDIRNRASEESSHSDAWMFLVYGWSRLTALWQRVTNQDDPLSGHNQQPKKALPFVVAIVALAVILILSFSLRALTQGKPLPATPTSDVSLSGTSPTSTPDQTTDGTSTSSPATFSPQPSPTIVLKTVTPGKTASPSATPVSSATRPPSGNGAVVNGGFETGTLSGWQCAAGDAVVRSPVASGSYAARLSPNSTDSTGECSQVISVQPNHTYSLSAYVQGSYAYLGITGGASTWTNSTSYIQLSVLFTTDASQTNITIYVHGWYQQGDVYVDNVSLQ